MITKYKRLNKEAVRCIADSLIYPTVEVDLKITFQNMQTTQIFFCEIIKVK